MSITYVLPLKWDDGQDLGEMTVYLQSLSLHTELLVVDGSGPENFNAHKLAWESYARHIKPHEDLNFINGKVNGVVTGFREAGQNCVIIGDDDVRYTADQLKHMEFLLQEAHLVVPQNYFDPAPWHAKWDTARSLLNRALWHDFPGTLGVQRDFINKLGGYDGNVLFENLELIRTIEAAGGKVTYADDFYIRRLPPTAKHFWSQRVRQAFDDYAQPARLIFFLLLIPFLAFAAKDSVWILLLLMTAAVLIAEAGRRKAKGRRWFAASCSLFAPVWLLERGFCTWLALIDKMLKGGVSYNGRIISKAANTLSKIRRRLQLSGRLT